VGLANLGSESETCVGSRVHLVGVSISFENFYRLPFTPPSLVRRIGPSLINIDNRLRSLDAPAERIEQGLQDTARRQHETDGQLYTLTTTTQEGFQTVNSFFGSWNPHQQPPDY
jgi:hypothetical protein